MLLPCRACTQVHIQFIFQNSNKPHHSTSFLPHFPSSTLHFTHRFSRLQKTIRKKKNSIFSPRTASRVNCKTRWKLWANCRSSTWKLMFWRWSFTNNFCKKCLVTYVVLRFDAWNSIFFPIPFSWCAPTMMGPHTAAVMMRIFKR